MLADTLSSEQDLQRWIPANWGFLHRLRDGHVLDGGRLDDLSVVHQQAERDVLPGAADL
jgi:hypothetical protein